MVLRDESFVNDEDFRSFDIVFDIRTVP